MWTKIKSWIQRILPKDAEFERNKMVYKTTERHMASIMKLKLEDEGIKVFVLNKIDSAYNNFGYIELYVDQDDVIRAKHIIEQPNE